MSLQSTVCEIEDSGRGIGGTDFRDGRIIRGRISFQHLLTGAEASGSAWCPKLGITPSCPRK